MCRKLAGTAIGKLCERCDGRCVICDSYVRPSQLVRICEECNFGNSQDRCIVCNAPGKGDAYYCRECVQLERDREGCPRIVNLGATKVDFIYERRRFGQKAPGR